MLPLVLTVMFGPALAYADPPLRGPTDTALEGSLSDSQIMQGMPADAGKSHSSSSHGGLMMGPKDPNAQGAGESDDAYRAMVNNTNIKIERTKAQLQEKQALLRKKTTELDALNKIQKELQKGKDPKAITDAQHAMQQALTEVTQIKKDIALFQKTIDILKESNARAEARLAR